MPRRGNPPIVDALQRTHEIMRKKLDSYRELRPEYEFVSMRNKRNDLILDAEEHPIVLEAVTNSIIARSEACKRVAGTEMLFIIRDILKAHAQETRESGTNCKIQHRFYNIKDQADLHPDSCYRNKVRQQRSNMQTFAAEMEAQCMIFYLERRNVANGSILEDDIMPFTGTIFKIDPKAEKALNDLRMIFLS